MKQLHPLLAKYSYIGDYGVSKLFSAKEDRNKLRSRIFGYSYIFIEAVEGGS